MVSAEVGAEFGGSLVMSSLRTFIRSLKKSMLTRWANREMPCSAEGSRGVGCGDFRILKYRTKRSFRVSVC